MTWYDADAAAARRAAAAAGADDAKRMMMRRRDGAPADRPRRVPSVLTMRCTLCSIKNVHIFIFEITQS